MFELSCSILSINLPKLDDDTLRTLCAQIAAGDDAAFSAAYYGLERLAYSAANRKHAANEHICRDDLQQAAITGLIQALRKMPTGHANPRAYVRTIIRGELDDCCREISGACVLPKNGRKTIEHRGVTHLGRNAKLCADRRVTPSEENMLMAEALEDILRYDCRDDRDRTIVQTLYDQAANGRNRSTADVAASLGLSIRSVELRIAGIQENTLRRTGRA